MTNKENAFGFTGDSIVDDPTLIPYLDNSLLRDRLNQPSRYLRREPEVTEYVVASLKANDDRSMREVADLLDAAQETHIVVGQAPIRHFISYVNLFKNLDTIASSLSIDSATSRLGTITYLAERLFTMHIPDDELEAYQAAAVFLYNRIDDLDISENDKTWYKIKIRPVEYALQNRRNVIEYVQGMPGSDEEIASRDAIQQDTDEIAAHFARARENQRYDIKSGYILQEGREGSIVFSPPFTEAMMERVNVTGLVAQLHVGALCYVADTAQTKFKNIELQSNTVGDGLHIFSYPFEARCSYGLLPNGELYLADSGEFVRDVAARQGKYGAYRRLQAEILAAYIDITTAKEIDVSSRRMVRRKSLGQGEEVVRSDEDQAEVQKILIARVIRAANGRSSDGEPTGRTRPPQDIIPHRQRLPKGHKASVEALRRAEELGITLAEGETFNRGHKVEEGIGSTAVTQFVRRPNT